MAWFTRARAIARSRSPERRTSAATTVAARVALALSFVIGLGGCEACGFRWGPPCEILTDYMCQRDLESRCDEVKAFLESRLIDDDGNPLAGAERDQMCSAIDATPELRNGYRFKAEQQILGTPHLDLSKKARDRRFEALNGYKPGEKPEDKAQRAAAARPNEQGKSRVAPKQQ